MLLWFAAPAVLGAWAVLRDPRFDYRLAAAGALLPDLLDAPFGERALAHTLVFAVAVLVTVMLATALVPAARRRAWRARLLAIPVGLLVHLVLHGVVGQSALLYWPFLGDWGHLALAPSVPVLVIEEVLGALAAWRVWTYFGLAQQQRRAAFIRTGRLEPC